MAVEDIDWSEYLKGMAAGSKRTPLEEAAPDLLEALEALTAPDGHTLGCGHYQSGVCELPACKCARTAIQKAKGD